jgi:heat shock protein HspQ
MPSLPPRFKIGQLVHHQKYGYRGVVFDIDLEFGLSDEWYDQVARSRPPKGRPWYRVLVHNSDHETYVAERHLEADADGGEVKNPHLSLFFDTFHGDHYARSRSLN